VGRKGEHLIILILVLFFLFLYTWQGWAIEEYIIQNNSLPIVLGLVAPLWAILAGLSMSMPRNISLARIDYSLLLIQGLPAFFLAFGLQLNYLLYVWTGINILAAIMPVNIIFFLDKLDLPLAGGLWLGIILTKALK